MAFSHERVHVSGLLFMDLSCSLTSTADALASSKPVIGLLIFPVVTSYMDQKLKFNAKNPKKFPVQFFSATIVFLSPIRAGGGWNLHPLQINCCHIVNFCGKIPNFLIFLK